MAIKIIQCRKYTYNALTQSRTMTLSNTGWMFNALLFFASNVLKTHKTSAISAKKNRVYEGNGKRTIIVSIYTQINKYAIASERVFDCVRIRRHTSAKAILYVQ